MIRYEIREICGDWAIYEVRETETEGGERCLLILNSRANAEYIKAILEHEGKYPNAAVPYRPEVAQMSDAECVAVNRLCCTGGNRCHACPVQSTEDEEAKCFDIERRVLQMAERWLLYRRPLEMVVRFQSLEEIEASLARSRKLLKETIAQSEATEVSKEVLTVLNKIESRVAEVIKGLEIECKQRGNPYFRTNVESRIGGLHYALKIIKDNKKKYTGGKTDEDISD